MIPRLILDALLIVVVGIWAALGLAIVIDRRRFDRRTQRSTSLQKRLHLAPGLASGAAREMTLAEFQEMVFSGLPSAVEASLAHQLLARHGEEHLRALAEGTTAADNPTRVRALQVLVSAAHEGAHYALDRCLRSGNRELASAAVRMLIRLDDRRAAVVLIDALCDGAYAASRLAAAVDRMSVPRSELLAPLLTHANSTPRFWGVRLAGRLGAREWRPRVAELTADPDPLVRRAAVETLGAIGEPKDRVLLLVRFLDPVPMVRVHAARASAAFATPEVADSLCELLRDPEWIVRAAARDALQRVGEVATAALTRALWDEDRFAANSAAEVLFLTGAALRRTRQMMMNPDDGDALRFVTRFLAVAGPLLQHALVAQLGRIEAARLRTLAAAGPSVAEGRPE